MPVADHRPIGIRTFFLSFILLPLFGRRNWTFFFSSKAMTEKGEFFPVSPFLWGLRRGEKKKKLCKHCPSRPSRRGYAKDQIAKKGGFWAEDSHSILPPAHLCGEESPRLKVVPARVVKVVVAVKEKRGGRKYTMTGSRKRRRKGEKASAGMEGGILLFTPFWRRRVCSIAPSWYRASDRVCDHKVERRRKGSLKGTRI